jgi:hypothetical protein
VVLYFALETFNVINANEEKIFYRGFKQEFCVGAVDENRMIIFKFWKNTIKYNCILMVMAKFVYPFSNKIVILISEILKSAPCDAHKMLGIYEQGFHFTKKDY